jgi:hypothetical protein
MCSDLFTAEVGQRQIGHLVIDAVADIRGQPVLGRRHLRSFVCAPIT